MSYVPRYLGLTDFEVRNGVTLFDDALSAEEIEKRQSEMKKALDDCHELDSMPQTNKSAAIWDLNVTIKSSEAISRLVSLNHPIGVQFAEGNSIANV